MQRKAVATVCEQPGEESDPKRRHPDSQHSAEEGQQQAFRQQLANDTQAAGPETQANRNLTSAGRRPREQKVGDIGACDGENQTDHGHEQI